MRRSATLLLLAISSALHAQGSDSARTSRDSALMRARQLVQTGKEGDGRKVLDSLLAVSSPDSADFPEILYWRAMSAPTAAAAEYDYRRMLIEVPLAARSEDALLQLAQLEVARGDRRGASDHLQRYLLSYPNSAARPRVSVQLVRLLFDLGPQQLARACDALRTARAEVPASSIELRNQLESNAPRCAYVEAQAPMPVADSSAAVPVVDTARARADSARPQPAPAPTGAVSGSAAAPPVAQPPAVAPTASPVPAAPTVPAAKPDPNAPAFYSVQVAAYDSQESAERMTQQLQSRGIDARVDGTAAPYRVRVGKYATRADAVKAQAELKAKGHSGFITLVGPK